MFRQLTDTVRPGKDERAKKSIPKGSVGSGSMGEGAGLNGTGIVEVDAEGEDG